MKTEVAVMARLGVEKFPIYPIFNLSAWSFVSFLAFILNLSHFHGHFIFDLFRDQSVPIKYAQK